MRRQVFSRFQHVMENLSRPQCRILVEVYNPEAQITAFEEPVRLVRVPRGAIADGGDHVLYMGGHFLLGPHSTEEFCRIFRLIPLPDQVVWKIQQSVVKDLVTGLDRQTGATFLTNIWCRRLTVGFSKDIKEADRQVVRFICGSTVQVGDQLDSRIIKRVYSEQGVMVAET